MPLADSFVRRSTDTSGDQIKTFDDPDGKKIQAAALVDENSEHTGTESNPLYVQASELPMPDGAATETTVNVGLKLASYGPNDVDSVSASLTYFGKENSGAGWMVQKITKFGSVTSFRYATALNNGSVLTYSDAWDDRATLTYGTFAEAL